MIQAKKSFPAEHFPISNKPQLNENPIKRGKKLIIQIYGKWSHLVVCKIQQHKKTIITIIIALAKFHHDTHEISFRFPFQ